MATAQKQNQPKILRIGVIQGGKIIEERLVKKRETVTIGQGSRNTIVIPVSNLPPSFPVFEFKGSSYLLRFTDAMQGRLSVGDSQLDFAALKAQGLAKGDKDGFAVLLTDQSKGKITLGEVTLLFQFVTPPPEAPKPTLPPIAKGSLWNTVDKVFFAVLVASLCVNFGTVKAVSLREAKAPEELTLEELPDRFVKMIVPEKPLEPPKPKDEVAAGEGDKKDQKGDDKPKVAKAAGPTGPVDTAARTAAIAKGVQNKGLLKLLGAIGDGGDGGGAIEDVLGSGSASGDIASALAGAGGVGVATSDALAEGGGRKGGGTGEAAGIGDLSTSGGASAAAGNLGEKKVAAVTGRVIDSGPEVESTSCDRGAIARYVKSRVRAIQNCYEKELKRNPSLKGKIVIRFTIGETGRVTEFEVDEDTLGNSSVVSCIRNTVRMWMFPIKDNECPVAYPFVFQPGTN